MKTISIEKIVFTLDEVKEQAIQRNWDINVDHDWWQFVYDDAATIFEMLGYSLDEKPPFFFSGFSSQGDGACINRANWSYVTGCVKAVRDYAPCDDELHRIARELQNIAAKSFYTGTASIQQSGYYYHEISMLFYTDCEKGYFDEANFQDVTTDLCKWLYKRLEADYNYLTREEAIEETLRCNGYEFDEDGNII
jgi:hypothetical protein